MTDKPTESRKLKHCDRVYCKCGLRKIAIVGATLCGRCNAKENPVRQYVPKRVYPMCVKCGKRTVRKQGMDTCWYCIHKQSERAWTRDVKPPTKAEQKIAPQCMMQMQVNQILKNWHRIQP